MAQRQRTGTNVCSRPGIQLIQAKEVRHGRSVEPEPLGEALVGHPELLAQAAERGGPVHGIQVLALQ
ncbi:MAG: hypothetical protein ACKORL_05945, partial [Phycisphaerales bacterium]